MTQRKTPQIPDLESRVTQGELDLALTPVQGDLELESSEVEPKEFTYDFPILGKITVKSKPKFRFYYLNDVNRMSGHSKTRLISAPNAPMKRIHQRFTRNLRKHKAISPHATGAIKGGSAQKNIARHADNRYFYQLDIHSAYQQVDMDKLSFILADIAGLEETERHQVLRFLNDFCLDKKQGGLMTGSPSSPDLYNLYMLPADEIMAEIAERHGMTYTRYLDDITFSSPDTGDLERDRIGKHKAALIRQVLADHDMPLSYDKARNDDLKNGPIILNGVQINPSGKWQLPTRGQRQVLAELDLLNQQLSKGIELSETQRAKLAGLNGLFRSNQDKRRIFRTDREVEILKTYEQVRHKDRALRRPVHKLGRVAARAGTLRRLK